MPASRSRGHSATISAELLQAAVGVARDPGLDGAKPGQLAGVGACRHLLRAREVARRGSLTLGRIHREDEARRDQRQHRALLFLVGGGDEVGEALAEAQPFLRDEIQCRDRTLVGLAQLQPCPSRATPVPRFRCASFACHATLGKTARRVQSGRINIMKRRHLLGTAAALAIAPALMPSWRAPRPSPTSRSASSCPTRRAVRPTRRRESRPSI